MIYVKSAYKLSRYNLLYNSSHLVYSFSLNTFRKYHSFTTILRSKHKLQIRFIGSRAKDLSVTVPKGLSNSDSGINPWFITGFTDGEGCFYLSVVKSNAYKTGWHIKISYEIHIHKKDQILLEQIQKFMNVGNIYSYSSTSIKYSVTSMTDLEVIIEHFNKYSL